MKTLKTVFMVMAVVLMSSLLLTCKKENDKSEAIDHEVAFAINISNLTNANGLKSTMGYNLADADKIILTIQFNDGSPTKYSSTEIKIHQMNGVYYTQKIVLKADNYKLTGFLILNATDSTIFVAPLTGSQEAQNVSSPLPIEFSVAKDITTPVNVEVLSTEKKKPEDFGLNRFPIIEVKTFGFMIGVADSENDKLLSAKLTVSNGSYSYIQNLDSIANNVATVKDGLSNYTVKVEKSGYKTYTHTYSMNSLKLYKDSVGNLPLLLELEKDNTGLLFEKVLTSDNHSSLYQMKPDGSNITFIHDQGTWASLSAIWSQDKSKILYCSNASTTGKTEIFLMNSNGSDNTQITTDNPQYGNNSAIFRNSSKIWYANAQSTGWTEFTEINYDGTGKTQLTHFNAQGKSCDFIHINKDSTKLCYYKQTSSWAPDGEIYISNLDFSNEVRLTYNSVWDGYPSFSPDGTKILYIHENNVYIMNIDGSNPTSLTAGQICTFPVWSPDGKKIAYSNYDGAQWDAWIMNADGSNQTNITHTNNYHEVITDWK